MPVYRETLDDVIGFIHVKDVLATGRGAAGAKLAPLLRKLLFVAPSMPLLESAGADAAGAHPHRDGGRRIRRHRRAGDDRGPDRGDRRRDRGRARRCAEPRAHRARRWHRSRRCPHADRELEERLLSACARPAIRRRSIRSAASSSTLAGRVPRRGEIIAHPSRHRVRGARRRSAPHQAAAGARPAEPAAGRGRRHA